MVSFHQRNILLQFCLGYAIYSADWLDYYAYSCQNCNSDDNLWVVSSESEDSDVDCLICGEMFSTSRPRVVYYYYYYYYYLFFHFIITFITNNYYRCLSLI